MFRESQIIGPYTLIRKLGRGGFGDVWLAERRAKFVTTKVAVKLPHDEQIDHEAIKQEATLWEQASGHRTFCRLLMPMNTMYKPSSSANLRPTARSPNGSSETAKYRLKKRLKRR